MRQQFFVGACGALRILGPHVAHELKEGVGSAVDLRVPDEDMRVAVGGEPGVRGLFQLGLSQLKPSRFAVCAGEFERFGQSAGEIAQVVQVNPAADGEQELYSAGKKLALHQKTSFGA